MPRGKPTITRDSVFRSTGQTPPVAQGLPSDEPTRRQTAIWLSDDETDWLDAQCRKIRGGGWRSVTRSALIRALVRARMKDTPDLDGVAGEHQLTERLSTKPR